MVAASINPFLVIDLPSTLPHRNPLSPHVQWQLCDTVVSRGQGNRPNATEKIRARPCSWDQMVKGRNRAEQHHMQSRVESNVPRVCALAAKITVTEQCMSRSKFPGNKVCLLWSMLTPHLGDSHLVSLNTLANKVPQHGRSFVMKLHPGWRFKKLERFRQEKPWRPGVPSSKPKNSPSSLKKE